MKANTWYLIGFVGMVVLQLFIPGRMIFQSENALQKGTALKFLTRPVDPNDPFRGKFVVLSFEASSYHSEMMYVYGEGQTIFVTITEGVNGFAEVQSISHLAPEETDTFVEARVRSVADNNQEQTVFFEYPFNRYYVNEKVAPEIEKKFREANQQDDQNTYATVRIRKGRGLIENLVIDGTVVD